MVCVVDLVFLVGSVYLVCLVGPGSQRYAVGHRILLSARAKMNANGQFPIDRLVAFHLGLEGPFIQRSHAGDGELPMLGRL